MILRYKPLGLFSLAERFIVVLGIINMYEEEMSRAEARNITRNVLSPLSIRGVVNMSDCYAE